MDKKGTFIVFEGGEGSGKDTQVARLKERLADRKDVVFTRAPGGTKNGERIRELLLSNESVGMDVRTELLLFIAVRAELVAEVVLPALEQGKTVISNRFGLSTIALQIYGRERMQYLSLLQEINSLEPWRCVPDYTVLLDVTPKIGLERAEKRPEGTNRFDEETVAFHERVQLGFKTHVHEFGVPIVIDADNPVEQVWSEVERRVLSLI